MSHKRTLPISSDSPLPSSIQSQVSLTWVKRHSPLYGRLSTNILREICEYFTFRPLLVNLDVTDLTVFSPLSKQLWKIHLRQVGISLNYQTPGRCVCIGSDDIFLCGGVITDLHKKECIPSTFVIESNQLRPLSDMKLGRYWHGLYYHEDSQSVLAFGGVFNLWYSTKSCEKYDIDTDCWSSLPGMKEAKINITTCGYREKVYICGHRSSFLEIFSINEMEFTIAPISLGISWSNRIPVIWGNKLVVAQYGKMEVFEANTYKFVAEFAVPGMLATRRRMVANDVLFFLENDKCTSIDLLKLSAGSSYT